MNFRSTTSLIAVACVLAIAFGQQTGKPDLDSRVVVLEKQVIALHAQIDVLEAKLDHTYEAELAYPDIGVPINVSAVDSRNNMVYLEDGSAWLMKAGSPVLSSFGYKRCFIYTNPDKEAPYRIVLENDINSTHFFGRYIGGKKKA